jgi:hypothetical protein
MQVRPIFANLNKSARWFMDEGKFSVDEIMIPYFGRHSSKQFICGKPIRYGFKVRNYNIWHVYTLVDSEIDKIFEKLPCIIQLYVLFLKLLQSFQSNDNTVCLTLGVGSLHQRWFWTVVRTLLWP